MRLLDLLSFPDWREAKTPRGDRTVLALGGGGARGLAHLGVIEAISRSPLELRRIVGVSMGALAGGLCAVDGNPQEAQSRAIDYLRSPDFLEQQHELLGTRPPSASESAGGLFSWYGRLRDFVQAHRRLGRAVSGPSLLGDYLLRDAVDTLLPDIDIAETAIPLSIVAADLLSGHRVVLESGPLRVAVRASMAIPGIFPPVALDKMLLCDVGVVDSIPVDVARSYPHDLAIAVDVGQGHARIQSCATAIDAMMRIDEIGERVLRRRVLDEADWVIRPELDGVAWFDFGRPEQLVRKGYLAGHEQLAKHHLADAA